MAGVETELQRRARAEGIAISKPKFTQLTHATDIGSHMFMRWRTLWRAPTSRSLLTLPWFKTFMRLRIL
jgi:hypothetical protein